MPPTEGLGHDSTGPLTEGLKPVSFGPPTEEHWQVLAGQLTEEQEQVQINKLKQLFSVLNLLLCSFNTNQQKQAPGDKPQTLNTATPSGDVARAA